MTEMTRRDVLTIVQTGENSFELLSPVHNYGVNVTHSALSVVELVAELLKEVTNDDYR